MNTLIVQLCSKKAVSDTYPSITRFYKDFPLKEHNFVQERSSPHYDTCNKLPSSLAGKGAQRNVVHYLHQFDYESNFWRTKIEILEWYS